MGQGGALRERGGEGHCDARRECGRASVCVGPPGALELALARLDAAAREGRLAGPSGGQAEAAEMAAQLQAKQQQVGTARYGATVG